MNGLQAASSNAAMYREVVTSASSLTVVSGDHLAIPEFCSLQQSRCLVHCQAPQFAGSRTPLCSAVQADQERSGVIDFQVFIALFIALTQRSAPGVQEAKTILLQGCAPCGCPVPDLRRPPCPTHACVATTERFQQATVRPSLLRYSPVCPRRPVTRTPDQLPL